MTVTIIGVGIFREILQETKKQLKIATDAGNYVTVYMILEQLDSLYDGRFAKALYGEDGKPNPLTRIMLNGRDIRFLEEEKRFVNDGDSILISSVMAGG